MTFPRSLCLAAGLLGAFAAPVFAQPEPAQIIDRALAAHGGAATLARLRARHNLARGVVYRETPVPFTQEAFYQAPNQVKEIMRLDTGGTQATVMTLLNGDTGRMIVNGQAQTLDDRALREMREGAHLALLVRLIELRRPDHQLSYLGEFQIAGRPAFGIKVAANGFRDVHLYFDKEYGLLVKAERPVLDLRTRYLLTEEAFYSNWKTVDGLVTPTKVTVFRDGKKFSEVEITQVRFLERLDGKVFTEP